MDGMTDFPPKDAKGGHGIGWQSIKQRFLGKAEPS